MSCTGRVAGRTALAALLLLAAALALAGCGQRGEDGRIREEVISSQYLGKEMRLSVLLPEGYTESESYPVLYFVPDYGGGPALVTSNILADKRIQELCASGEIEPMIIVGVRHDRSFLLDNAEQVAQITTDSGKTLGLGLYESYFIREVIPYIEEHYPTVRDAAGRYIGGYSMGGYAALRLSLASPALFSRVGGHSPTLFFESLPDEEVARFLYPDEQTRARRDPLLLVETVNLVPGVEYYIDTGATDINRAACEVLCEKLRAREVPCELHLFPGTHGRDYWFEYMSDYMLFYGKW